MPIKNSMLLTQNKIHAMWRYVQYCLPILCFCLLMWNSIFAAQADDILENYTYSSVKQLLDEVEKLRPDQLPIAVKLMRQYEQPVVKQSTESELKSFYLLLSEFH